MNTKSAEGDNISKERMTTRGAKHPAGTETSGGAKAGDDAPKPDTNPPK